MNLKKCMALCTSAIVMSGMFGGSISTEAYEKNNKDYEVLVTCKNNNIDENLKRTIKEKGGEIVEEIPQIGVLEVRGNKELLNEVSKKQNVESVEFNSIMNIEEKYNPYYKNNIVLGRFNTSDYYKKDLFTSDQWDVRKVTNDGASFYLEQGNHNVVVGIIDSGIDIDHPDLKDNLLGGVNLVPAGYDKTETGDLDDIQDRYGHGTQIAGEIAANGRSKGVAPGIGFRSYRVSGKDGKVSMDIVSKGIVRAVDDGVKVINLSLSDYFLDGDVYQINPATGEEEILEKDSKEFRDKFERNVIKKAVDYAYNHNVVVVTCAGNEGLDYSTPEKLTEECNKGFEKDNVGIRYKGKTYKYPAMLSNVINVSATNRKDEVTAYSNYGQGYISVAAPGGQRVGIYDLEDFLGNLCVVTSMDGSYILSHGTSLAAPKVSAEAALIICKYGNLTPEEVKKKICDTADKAGDESKYGAGIINVYNALK